jgi:hypothetical protein
LLIFCWFGHDFLVVKILLKWIDSQPIGMLVLTKAPSSVMYKFTRAPKTPPKPLLSFTLQILGEHIRCMWVKLCGVVNSQHINIILCFLYDEPRQIWISKCKYDMAPHRHSDGF